MIILIAGPSHTGKTALAQRLLEKYNYPYLSIDHLKMGLIRSGRTNLTPLSSDMELTAYLWPVVREMVKTAVENNQNMIVEGCYIPYDWKNDFSAEYGSEIKCIRFFLSENYIRSHFDDIRAFSSVIESRLDDSDLTMDSLIEDNLKELSMCEKHGIDYFCIDRKYDPESVLLHFGL